jgi:CheY-like chemotaxis protein
VLVVDDEAFFRRLLSETVERQGYTVLGARDASETLRFFERAAPTTRRSSWCSI